FNAPSLMSSPFTRSIMMYPGELDGQRLKIVAETNLHTFTFYATPKLSLQAGTVYHFPISLGFQDYEQDDMGAAQATDLAYTMVEKDLKPFYYYGEHNSYIVKPNVATTVNCTPYKSNVYYHKTGTPAALDAANRPTQAKVIWYETAMGAPTLGAFNASNYTFTVTTPAGKYGNALVGVYNAAGKILWSYHIWVPQDDPTKTLTYANTKSGAYEVMPLALGATKIGSYDNPTEAEAAGLCYQWGRKDPLGRPNSMTTSGVAKAVTTVAGAGVPAATASTAFFTTQADNLYPVVEKMQTAGYGDTDGSVINNEIDGISVDRYMAEQSIINPTKFFKVETGSSNYWSGAQNDNFWGNPDGRNFPRPWRWQKSIFDPCPAGYRVSPYGVCDNFTTTQVTHEDEWYHYNIAHNSVSGNTRFKSGYEFYYEGMGVSDDEAKTYTPPVNGKTDFYPASGQRNQTANITSVGILGYYWTNVDSGVNTPWIFTLYINTDRVAPGNGVAQKMACPLRCVKELQQ
ncbi:MAG: hypothetical protein K2H42_02515, partial [Alistipes sp.]|nr:hypothetical protein [Alistipes sp.]